MGRNPGSAIPISTPPRRDGLNQAFGPFFVAAGFFTTTFFAAFLATGFRTGVFLAAAFTAFFAATFFPTGFFAFAAALSRAA